MLVPRIDCTIYRGSVTDIYGNTRLGSGESARCAIVRLFSREENVTVRADSSASRGAAQEMVADAILLFLPGTKAIAIDDVVELMGVKVKITGVFPRHSVNGVLDHYQAEGMQWE